MITYRTKLGRFLYRLETWIMPIAIIGLMLTGLWFMFVEVWNPMFNIMATLHHGNLLVLVVALLISAIILIGLMRYDKKGKTE